MAGTLLYLKSDNGKCIAKIFSDVLNEVPQSHHKYQLKAQVYMLRFDCINTVMANNSACFTSMASAASAVKVYPTFRVEHRAYDKP